MQILFCDTNCELNYTLAKEYGLKVIKMPYTLCDKEEFYDLGEHYDAKDFFDKIRAGNMPITSALNAEDYKEYFEPYFAAGDDILYISFSSQMSGTFNYMDMAIKELAPKYPNAKFTRFDTKGISMSAGLAVYIAAKAYKDGQSNEQIIKLLTPLINNINAFAVVDDLNHLKRGGRLSAIKALIGSLLNLKPIIKMTTEGKLAPISKVPGRKKALQTLINEVIASATDLDKYPIAILDADCREESNMIKAKLQEALPNAILWQNSVGPVIGTHCGPGTLAICFVGGTRPETPKD